MAGVVAVGDVKNVVADLHLGGNADSARRSAEEAAINRLAAVEEVPHIKARANVFMLGDKGHAAVPHNALAVKGHAVGIVEDTGVVGERLGRRNRSADRRYLAGFHVVGIKQLSSAGNRARTGGEVELTVVLAGMTDKTGGIHAEELDRAQVGVVSEHCAGVGRAVDVTVGEQKGTAGVRVGDLSETSRFAGMYVINVAGAAHPGYCEIIAVLRIVGCAVGGIVGRPDAKPTALAGVVVVGNEV